MHAVGRQDCVGGSTGGPVGGVTPGSTGGTTTRSSSTPPLSSGEDGVFMSRSQGSEHRWLHVEGRSGHPVL
ncbi:MAG: hypothetical protein JST64_14495 [Actinobacteria bacterium]|nr:hypothetical protein [Actinomycetota bacterium]